MEWLDIRGSLDGARYTDDTREACENWGEASDRCPEAGTGVGIGARQSGPGFVFELLQVHHNPAQLISGVRGALLRSDLYRCSQNADYWGYSAGALKTVNEQESAYNLVHDNEAVGLWCDQGCRPEAMQFSESDASRSRTDLWNAEAYDNRLGGEAMDGCGTYTGPDKLRCYDNPP